MSATPDIAIVGAGPAGLMAAEMAARAGFSVSVFDAMARPGRKLLLAGKSGLNITHAEPFERFAARYGGAANWLQPALDAFGPEAVRAFCADLGIETFVGSSGRVFPKVMKASPLLRAWLKRLEGMGVGFAGRRRLTGIGPGPVLEFAGPEGAEIIRPKAAVLALGGASYARLGSDGAWAGLLASRGVALAPFRPANMGFDVNWPDEIGARFAGAPLKPVRLSVPGAPPVTGECVISATGIEGNAVYTLSEPLRDALAAGVAAPLTLDLAPGVDLATLTARLQAQPGKLSVANRLRRGAKLTGAKAALVRMGLAPEALRDAAALAARIKACPVPVARPRPIDEAISTAGGVARGAVDAAFGLTALPGVFVAGEMLDWSAPTGGYLLTGVLATGRAAGVAAAQWAKDRA